MFIISINFMIKVQRLVMNIKLRVGRVTHFINFTVKTAYGRMAKRSWCPQNKLVNTASILLNHLHSSELNFRTIHECPEHLAKVLQGEVG